MSKFKILQSESENPVVMPEIKKGQIIFTKKSNDKASLSYDFEDDDRRSLDFTGPQGDQGSIGLRGFQGFDGEQGNQGFQGIPGFGIYSTDVSMTDINTTNPPLKVGDLIVNNRFSQITIGNEIAEPGDVKQVLTINGTTFTVSHFGNTRGVQGPLGIQGPVGYQGTQGLTGYTGYQGQQGTQGLTGTTGYQGQQGTQGTTGYQGYQGTQGTTGYQGYQGTQGLTGYTGYQGQQGTQGLTGYTGYQGQQGTQGLTGTTGYQGYQGTQGTTGYQGYQGTQGLTGYTGYQGQQGTQGTTGYQGYQGTQGLTGTTGYTGYVGVVVMGEQGYQGYMGAQGYEGNCTKWAVGDITTFINTDFSNSKNGDILLLTEDFDNSNINFGNIGHQGDIMLYNEHILNSAERWIHTGFNIMGGNKKSKWETFEIANTNNAIVYDPGRNYVLTNRQGQFMPVTTLIIQMMQGHLFNNNAEPFVVWFKTDHIDKKVAFDTTWTPFPGLYNPPGNYIIFINHGSNIGQGIELLYTGPNLLNSNTVYELSIVAGVVSIQELTAMYTIV